MMDKLLCVSKPRSDENIYNFINRLTIENRYDSNTWILRVNIHSYFGPRNILPHNFDFNPLIKLTRMTMDELLKLTYYYEFGWGQEENKYFNHLLYRENLMGKQAKICPVCLDEFGQSNKLWDIRLLLVCPIHKCLLINKCDNCGREIQQYRIHFFYCKCKADLRKSNIQFITIPIKYCI